MLYTPRSVSLVYVMWPDPNILLPSPRRRATPQSKALFLFYYVYIILYFIVTYRTSPPASSSFSVPSSCSFVSKFVARQLVYAFFTNKPYFSFSYNINLNKERLGITLKSGGVFFHKFSIIQTIQIFGLFTMVCNNKM